MKKIIFFTFLFVSFLSFADCRIVIEGPFEGILTAAKHMAKGKLTESSLHLESRYINADIGLKLWNVDREYTDSFGRIGRETVQVFQIFQNGRHVLTSLPFYLSYYRIGGPKYIFTKEMQDDFIEKINQLGCY
jgi:hypothetical protein